MKNLLIFIISLISISTLSAQNVQEQAAKADSLKNVLGKYDETYLSALSNLVAEVYYGGNYEYAYALRSEHAEIVKEKYGEGSMEYAEDLWKLGNISSFKGNQCRIDCYTCAKNIFEKLGATDTYPYCDILWQLFKLQSENKDLENAAETLSSHLRCCKGWLNQEYRGVVMITGEDLLLRYSYLGNTYLNLGNHQLSINAFEEAICIAKKFNINDERHVRIYYMLRYLYSELNNVSKELETQITLVENIKLLYGEDSDKYIEELTTLNLNYWENSDLEAIKTNSYRILDIISTRCKKTSTDISKTYLDVLAKLVSYCTAFMDWNGVIQEGQKLLILYRQADLDSNLECWELLEDLICAHHNVGDYATEISLYDEFEKLATELNQKVSKTYCDYLIYKLETYSILCRFEDCQKVIDEKIILTQKLFGEFSLESLISDLLIIQYFVNFKDNSNAIEHIDRCHRTLSSGKCDVDAQDSLMVASNLNHLYGKVLIDKEPEKAEKLLRKSIEEFSMTSQPAAAPYVDLGLLYINIRRDHKSALDFFEIAKKILEEQHVTTSLDYMTILNNIAVCYQALSKTSEAIAILDLQEQLLVKHYGTSHPTYAYLLINKSEFYARITDYITAIKYGEEGKKVIEELYGNKSEEFAHCLSNLGYYYTEIAEINKAKVNLLKAIEIFKECDSQTILFPYVNMLNIYYTEKDWTNLDSTIRTCFSLLKDWNLEYTDIAATFTGAVGYIYALEKNPEAKKYFKYAIESCERGGRTDAEEYLTYKLYYYLSHFIDNSYDESLIENLLTLYKNSYFKNAIFYNAVEREMYVSSPRYSQIKDILFSARTKGENDGNLYDFLLFNKGLLLGTSAGFTKAIIDSDDSTLLARYNELVELRRYINGEKLSGFTYSIDEAKEKAKVLERDITQTLREKGGYSNGLNLTWKDVRQALKSDECAIEFVVYKDLLDSRKKYAALVVKKEIDKPLFIKLCDADEIEKYATIQPNITYSPTSKLSEELYGNIWAPIIHEIIDINKVYFSTAGVLSQMALEQLCDGNKRLCDSKILVRVSSTREVCNQIPQMRYSRAVLYGGLYYDEDVQSMIDESHKVRGKQAVVCDRFRGDMSDNTRGNWAYLPATLTEVKEISSIINKKISKHIYTGSSGNEESFKALSGDDLDILHIATHGFYMNESKAERNEFFSTNPLHLNMKPSSSALYRSGLMLAGGNFAWRGELLPEDIEDGVLTAAEIANMDLSKCDLVVISACETGLGEITDEGVYGLQRAFKNAGVSTIIMSLWEVDDQATSYMMQNFYKNLVRGKTKREAFSMAQAEVKKKYSDPRYWAAFIMLD